MITIRFEHVHITPQSPTHWQKGDRHIYLREGQRKGRMFVTSEYWNEIKKGGFYYRIFIDSMREMFMEYTYLGDRMTDTKFKGKQCKAVRRPDGKCIRGRNGSMLVEFIDGTRVNVIGRLLRKIK